MISSAIESMPRLSANFRDTRNVAGRRRRSPQRCAHYRLKNERRDTLGIILFEE
jgi:hypothetical protein